MTFVLEKSKKKRRNFVIVLCVSDFSIYWNLFSHSRELVEMASDMAGQLQSGNACCKMVWTFFDYMGLCFYFEFQSVFIFLNYFLLWVLNGGVVWQWKEKYASLEYKRNALRQAVNILQPQIDRFQAENANLRKG